MARRKVHRESRAEQLRRHRETFDYAMRHGLTLREAERQLARARHAAAMARLRQAQSGATAIERAGHAPEHAPWLLRD